MSTVVGTVVGRVGTVVGRVGYCGEWVVEVVW